MDTILENLHLSLHKPAFQREKITPDIVCHLSRYDMECLGISNSSDMMKIRIECVKYAPVRIQTQGNCFNISKQLLESLLDSGFKISEISKLLSVSERTLYRRMAFYELSVRSFTQINDAELKTEVNDALTQFPRSGENMLRQILYQKGIKVPRSRLRDCLHEIDSDGITQRALGRLHRRTYHVEAPNHLWHLDTNHKLIRWHFVIAGAIDGFSRFIVMLKCLSDNKAQSIFNCFKSATEHYTIPLRLRTDQGMENIRVAEYMISTRGDKSILVGKSTHNQRIERLWRDVYDGVLAYYYDLFYFMEDKGILDPLNEMHLFILHRVYLQHINMKIEIWKNAWARHRLRTVRTSPQRLYMAGLMNTPIPDVQLLRNNQTNDSSPYEIDPSRPQLNPFQIEIDSATERDLNALCEDATFENHGIELYKRAVEIMSNQDLV